MDFKPVELCRETFWDDDEERPHVLGLNTAPSPEWVEAFEAGVNWSVVVRNAPAPRVVPSGIAVPSLRGPPLKNLLDHIGKAIRSANETERRRVADLPPDPKATYEQWFDEQTHSAEK